MICGDTKVKGFICIYCSCVTLVFINSFCIKAILLVIEYNITSVIEVIK